MADFIYDNYQLAVQKGDFDLLNDTIKISLHTSSYTPNEATHSTTADLTNEVTSDGYTAGGNTLANLSLALATGTVTFDADDSAWTGVTFSARYAVIYSATASNKLIALIDFGTDQEPSAQIFNILFNASGITTLTE